MTVPLRVADLSRPAQVRRASDDGLSALPVVVIAAAIAWRVGGQGAAGLVTIVGLLVVAIVAHRRARRLDRRWLVRQLDTRRSDMDDSADLLFADDPALTPLQQLQRGRLQRRLDEVPVDLRPAWSTRRMTAAWATATIAVTALVIWPVERSAVTDLAPSNEAVASAPGVPRLIGQRLRIVPPAYTGLPSRNASALDVRAPQGSGLDWTLRFAPQPDRADLVFADGGRTALVRTGDLWTTRRRLDRSALYRIVPHGPAGQPLPRLHRLDAIADAPPQVTVIAPDRSLSLVTPGQRRWQLTFAASDDYGVAPVAELHLTVAEGEGEDVKFREQVVVVHGTGPATARRFSVQPDLAALRFVVGSDLVAQLIVHDTRTPLPQTARSPSLILRWPGSTGDAAGMEGVVTRALPAYFRSERQVIIDAEALLKERSRLPPARFVARSDAIGADQRLLRLRYGQFLGEEQEGKSPPPPTADAETPAPVTADDGTVVKPAFGSETNTLADYGHVHDESEAATLLDPGTRTTLKAALDAMWQSELNLRQGAPAAALPFAYKALGLIKQVQQATRLFLARVGPELPPIDETRRLTGKRDGLDHRDLPAVAATAVDPAAATAWRALAELRGIDPAQLATLEGWLRANPTNVADPLAFAAAIDAVRRDPACGVCRQTLRGLLWSALPRPAPGVLRRDVGNATGRRYLDALHAAGR